MNESITPPPFSKQVSSHRYFHLRTRPTEDQITVYSAGREKCAPDYLIERPGYPGHAIEFVVDGSGDLLLDGHSHPLYAGVAFAYDSSVPHRIRSDPSFPMTKYFVNFSGHGARELLEDCGMPPGQVARSMDLAGIAILMELIIQDGASDEHNGSDLCVLYLQAIARKIAGGLPPESPADSAAYAQMQQWRAFIEQHFLTLHDLNDIARALNIRPAQLCRVFKRFNLESPYRHLTRCKMNHAAGLLATRDIQVKQVADQTGYADPYHFSRLFKRYFGHSPREFAGLYRGD